MLYQKLLTGREPYLVVASMANAFEAHRHPEIELSYCLEGSYTIVVDGERFCLHEGDLAIVLPMVAHEFPKEGPPTGRRLTIELGPGILGEYFGVFGKLEACDSLLHLKTPSASQETAQQLAVLLEETARLYRNRSDFSGLAIKGNLYKMSALLLQQLAAQRSTEDSAKVQWDVEKIEQSLEIIYNRYDEPLELESVSSACGYSKSNFCRVFKRVTGETFHSVLNRHRIEMACMHLAGSRMPVEKVALSVGFADTKSFCRVFKRVMGESPGAYRTREMS